MRAKTAILQFSALLSLTTAVEFSALPWAPWFALLATLLLALHWTRQGKQRWILYGVLILTLFPEFQSGTLGGLELHHILALVLAVVVLVPWLVVRPRPLPRLSRLLILYYGVALAVTLLQAGSLASTHRLLTVSLFVLIALLVPFVVTKRQELLELFWVLTAATLVSLVVGLAAYYYASLTHTLFTNPYIHISTVEGVPRLAATVLDSNFLGHQLLLIVPGLLLITHKLQAHLPRLKRTALFLVTTFCLAALWLTYSRSTYLGLAVALVVLLLAVRQKIWRTLLSVTIASLALATILISAFPFYSIYRVPSRVLPTETKERLLLGFNPRALVDEYIAQIQSDPTLSEEEREQLLARDVSSESLGYRIEFWKAGIRMFKDHPVLGVGVGQFRYRFTEYSDLSFIQQPDMHNIFIEQLAETGLLGELALLFVLGYACLVLTQTIRHGTQATKQEASVLLAVLLALLTQSLLLGGLGALPMYLALGVSARYASSALYKTKKPQAARRRVVFITATTKKDGPGNVLFTQIKGLDRTRFEPIVLTILRGGPWDPEYRKMGVRRINLRLRKPLDLAAPFILWILLRRLRPALVQTQMIRGDVYGRWAALRADVPFISVVHNMDIWKQTKRRFHRFATWFDAQGLLQARAVVAVSDAVKKHLHTRQGINLDMITVIRNAVDFKRFAKKPSAGQLAHLRLELGIPPGAPVVFTVARVHPQKAPEIWLQAALQVLRTQPQVYFVWADRGPLLNEMRRAVPPQYRKQIKFIGFRTDIAELLYLGDLFVLPSRFEGLPMVLLEAMAAGQACIATNVSGNPELIAHNERGVLVAPNQPLQLATALRELLTDQPRRERLGRAAQRFIQQNFTSERLSREYQDLFVALLS